MRKPKYKRRKRKVNFAEILDKEFNFRAQSVMVKLKDEDFDALLNSLDAPPRVIKPLLEQLSKELGVSVEMLTNLWERKTKW